MLGPRGLERSISSSLFPSYNADSEIVASDVREHKLLYSKAMANMFSSLHMRLEAGEEIILPGGHIRVIGVRYIDISPVAFGEYPELLPACGFTGYLLLQADHVATMASLPQSKLATIAGWMIKGVAPELPLHAFTATYLMSLTSVTFSSV